MSRTSDAGRCSCFRRIGRSRRGAIDHIQVKLSGLELRRARAFGDCWLACELWRTLGLEAFWQERLPAGREDVPWEKVLRRLVVNRWIAPGSEFRVPRQWVVDSAMDELLGVDFAVAEPDRLYRCLGRRLAHKQDLFVWLRQQWADLFHADFDVLLYDLTSTYFDGEMEKNPKAKRGYSRDGRPDCVQHVIALVITPEGFPLAYEGLDGNTSDRTTLRGFLDRIEHTYGKAKRTWVMDRGIPTDAILVEMRPPTRQLSYLVGTSKSKITQYEQQWLELPGQKVRDSVDVKLFEQDGELYVLAKSTGRQAKETAMRRKRLVRLLRKLRAMRHSLPVRDRLLMRLGAAKTDAGRAFGFVHIDVPSPQQAVTREAFRFRIDKVKLKAAELRDGHYLLRSNLTEADPAVLWTRYVQLTQFEAVFRSLKSELRVRPIHHQLEHRADAHITDCVSGVLSAGHAEAATAGACPRPHARDRPGKTGHDSNDRCLHSHHRWPLADLAPLHAAGHRHEDAAASTQDRTTRSTAPTHHLSPLGGCARAHVGSIEDHPITPVLW